MAWVDKANKIGFHSRQSLIISTGAGVLQLEPDDMSEQLTALVDTLTARLLMAQEDRDRAHHYGAFRAAVRHAYSTEVQEAALDLVIAESQAERFAAVAVLEVLPRLDYLRWLSERVIVEHPYVAACAAEAIVQAALSVPLGDLQRVDAAAKQGIELLTLANKTGGDAYRKLLRSLTVLQRISSATMMSGVQFSEVMDALVDAYSLETLPMMVKTRLGIRLTDIVSLSAGMRSVVFNTLEAAERAGWEVDLIEAAFREQPRNKKLAAVYEKYGLSAGSELQQHGKVVPAPASAPVVGTGFERKVKEFLPWIDMGRLVAISGQVCYITVGGRAMGTGFLVGKDVVLTNYHVVDEFIKPKPVAAAGVRCKFDYRSLPDDTRGGVEVGLLPGTDWLVDFSPYSPAEEAGHPDRTLPTDEQLDYALIRLERSIGAEPVDRNAESGAPARGWIKIPPLVGPDLQPAFAPPMPLMIVQHPDGSPLKLAIDYDAVINLNNTGTGLNANRTRVRYATNTESGSSGSPVFDSNWNLVALHHYGDPAWGQPMYNQGIPIGAIRALLEARNKEGALA